MAFAIDPVLTSYLDFLKAQRQTRWAKIDTYRDYTDGDVNAQMTDDQKILLVGADAAGNPNSDPEFNINVCGTILDAETDRLSIRSIRVTIPDNEELSEQVSSELWRWWEMSGMADGQQHAHFSAGRDGDSYPIVDYDKGFPRITLNMAYDGASGTEVAYEDAYPDKALYAVKRWDMQRPVIGNAITNRMSRMNLYFDNRIEYYISKGMAAGSRESGWQRLSEKDRDYVPALMQEAILQDPYGRDYTATVVWLTANGQPNGIPTGNPVKHLRHDSRGGPYGRSRIADIVPGLQDAINRSGVSLQAAALLSGFKELLVTGFFPQKNADGTSNAIKRYPGATQYIESPDATFSQTTETDLMQLIAVMEKFIVLAATLTSTPLSLFNLTAQTPAEGTQKQLESALITAVENAQRSYGRTWQDVVKQQIKFDTLYNDTSLIPLDLFEAIDDFDINIEWEPAATRNDKEEREIAVMDYTQLDMPKEFIWERFYDAETIKRMEQMASQRQNNVLGSMALMVADLEAQNAAQLAAGETIVNAQEDADNVDDGTDRELSAAGNGARANGAGSPGA